MSLAGLASNDVTEKLHVDLSGAPQTMLATFYAKALDADLEKPILGDRWAKDIVDRIDYDWSKTTITARTSPSVTTRSAHFDDWARQFLAVHPEAIVLHLGCGLDSRYFRVNPGPGVEWYDVDYPDVAELRRQLLPEHEHCHVVSASVTDPAWLADIPADRPTLMIGEGLTMYLTEQDGVALLRRIVDHAPSGELQFDAFSRFGIKTQWTNAVVKRSGATLLLGDRRARRHHRGGARRAAVAVGVAVRLRDVRQRVLALSGDGQGDVGVFDAALHGAVPPLRVLRTPLPEHRLTTAALVEIGAPRRMAALVAPHEL